MTIEEVKKKRFQFLHKLYETTDGDETAYPLISEISEQLGFDMGLAQKIVTYLSGEGLAIRHTFAGDIGITHEGIVEVEEALSNPDRPTQHFLPVNIIHIDGDMVSSQIQQASPRATQEVIISGDEHQKLKDIIQPLKESIDKLNLNTQQETDLQAEIRTIEAQASSSMPKRIIITESLNTIRSILQGGAGSILASELLSKVAAFLGTL